MSNERTYTPRQLFMLRRAAPVPSIRLNPGWTVRSMRPGEGALWADICVGAGFFENDAHRGDALYHAIMGSDPNVEDQNVFFACDPHGRPVATAAARFIPEAERGKFPPSENPQGCLHYVAALPQSRGNGAGTAVIIAVLRCLEALGLPDCVLSTDDPRLSAISIYLKLGWLPVLDQPDMAERWRVVLAQLSVKEVATVRGDGTIGKLVCE